MPQALIRSIGREAQKHRRRIVHVFRRFDCLRLRVRAACCVCALGENDALILKTVCQLPAVSRMDLLLYMYTVICIGARRLSQSVQYLKE
jgi:hypothetical protein